MLQGIDHVVVLVPDLDEAVEAYDRLGFTVVPGGRHNFATHNALIAFDDGSYLELIAFWEHASSHRWHRFLSLGSGLVDYCMRTTDLAADVAALRSRGIAMSQKQPMIRQRPDGYRLEWALSLATATQGVTPFLIEDLTPREERVPRQTTHPNGVTGIAALTLAVPDLSVARKVASLFDAADQAIERDDHGGRGLRFVSGRHAIEYLAPASASGAIASFLAGRDGEGGVFALTLATSSPRPAGAPGLTQGARILFSDT